MLTFSALNTSNEPLTFTTASYVIPEWGNTTIHKRLDSGADVAQTEGAAVIRKAAGIVLPCQNEAPQRVQGDLKILRVPGLAGAAFSKIASPTMTQSSLSMAKHNWSGVCPGAW
jgi:hypothetical protein